MNNYHDIIDALHRLLSKPTLDEDTKQLTALVIALAHRTEKDGSSAETAAPRSG